MRAKDWFLDFSRGAALGTGILPGVSVGTTGMIVGVYDKLLSAINGLRKDFWKSALQLLPIALGCLFVAFILFYFEKYIYEFAPFATTCVFAGLTAGGVPVIYKELKGRKPSAWDIVRVVLGFIIASAIGIMTVAVGEAFDLSAAFLAPNSNAWIYIILFVAGFVAAAACLLPGISGSMVIFIFGVYNPIRNIVKSSASLGEKALIVLALLAGVIIGLISFSKTMSSLLEKHRRGTFLCVLGFVLGSILSMFVNNQIWPTYSSRNVLEFVIGGIFVVLSAVGLVLLLKRHSHN